MLVVLLELDVTPHTLNSSLIPAFPSAPFSCALIKAGQTLEGERLGQKQLLREDHVARWNESTAGQAELEQSTVGGNETLKDAFGQNMHTEGSTGQMEVPGDASSWNKTLVDSETQQPPGAGAAGQEAGDPERAKGMERTTSPGQPGRGPALWSEPTQGPAWQNETTVPAPRHKDRVESAAGQNQMGDSAGQNNTGAIQTVHGSNWGHGSEPLQFIQINSNSALENSNSRITGGSLCHRGHCPWQVTLFSPSLAINISPESFLPVSALVLTGAVLVWPLHWFFSGREQSSHRYFSKVPSLFDDVYLSCLICHSYPHLT